MRIKTAMMLVAPMVALLVLCSTELRAQSLEFPNVGGLNVVVPASDPVPANAALGPVVTFKTLPRIRGFYDVPDCTAGCADVGVSVSGEAVAAGIANAVCAAAGVATVPWACSPCTLAPGVAGTITCTLATGEGIVIEKDAGVHVEVKKAPAAMNPRIHSLLLFNGTVGNDFDVDLNQQVLLQVVPNGVNGTVTFRVVAAGGGSPITFTRNTGSFATSEALHTSIAAGFQGLGLGLEVAVLRPDQAAIDPGPGSREGGQGQLLSGDPQQFSQGYLIAIRNAGAILSRVGVDVLPGQIAVVETNDTPWPTPTLSEWAMILLIGLLLGSGVWMLRRLPFGG